MVSRRHVIGGFSALAIARPLDAWAAAQCTPVDSQGAQECVAGVIIGPIQTVRQRCDNWCWAACIEAVFSIHGKEIAQEWAVEKIFGTDKCKGAAIEQIVQAIDGEWRDQYGLAFHAGAEHLPDATMSVALTGPRPPGADRAVDTTLALFSNDGAKAIVSELERGNPLIIGYNPGGPIGHAVVLSAVRYVRDSTGFVHLTELTVRDPWGDNPNRRTLKPAEVSGAFFVAKVWVKA